MHQVRLNKMTGLIFKMGKPKTFEMREAQRAANTPVDFEDLQKVAVKWVVENIKKQLSQIEASLLSDDGATHIWSKERADRAVGQAMALAFVAGYKQAKEAPLNARRILV